MDFNRVDPEPILDSGDDLTARTANMFRATISADSLDGDDSIADTPVTPSETVAADLRDDSHHFDGPKSGSFLVPWPGSTFIIRSVSSGEVITLLDGQIILARPGGKGCIYWACVESKGWLGFQNVVSGAFLGHDAKGKLCCSVKRHQGWERFCLRPKPEGGCVLLMTHYSDLWHVGIVAEQEVEKLAKVGEGGSDGIVWEFVKV
ncbi:MAG: hypothetical protein LQ346_002253 [Caloplaca aetnensis]|nr:MAG: hypothetical protein LQ346_002253 [Caloplaca aetnensis]